MPNFCNIFAEAKGNPVFYNGNRIIRIDKFPIKNEDILIASIEKISSSYRQGLCIDITGYCEFEGQIYKQGKGIRMLFWEDTAPKQIILKIFTKIDFVKIYNIWETISYVTLSTPTGEPFKKEMKRVDYSYNGAAMIVEEIENGRRYRCNDGYPDDDFDDIVFTVQKIKD